MVEDFLAAVIQMNSQEDKEANVAAAVQLIDEAARAGAKLVALPEYFNFLGREELKHNAAEDIPGPTTKALCGKAKELKIWLHGGSILEKGPRGRDWNTTVLINPTGQIVAKYRKIHLFDVVIEGQVEARESATIEPGREAVVAETELGNIGLSICYDIRFPELYRAMMNRGANVIMTPAAFTLYTGKDHWEAMLRTRAVENQSYLLAPAQCGNHPVGKTCYGNSMIIDPWGTVIARAPEGVGWVMARIQMKRLHRIRLELPALQHIRRDVFAI